MSDRLCPICGTERKGQVGMNHEWPGQVVPLYEMGSLTYCPKGCDIGPPYVIVDGRVVCKLDHEPVTALCLT
jgi:hypothetical protein